MRCPWIQSRCRDEHSRALHGSPTKHSSNSSSHRLLSVLPLVPPAAVTGSQAPHGPGAGSGGMTSPKALLPRSSAGEPAPGRAAAQLVPRHRPPEPPGQSYRPGIATAGVSPRACFQLQPARRCRFQRRRPRGRPRPQRPPRRALQAAAAPPLSLPSSAAAASNPRAPWARAMAGAGDRAKRHR